MAKEHDLNFQVHTKSSIIAFLWHWKHKDIEPEALFHRICTTFLEPLHHYFASLTSHTMLPKHDTLTIMKTN